MLLTLSCNEAPAERLSYLLHKHPARFQSFDLSFGKAHVFYPEANEAACTACLMLEVDPIGIVRRTTPNASSGFQIGNYVNDRPFVCSSFMSVAISQVFGTALNGRCKQQDGNDRRRVDSLSDE